MEGAASSIPGPWGSAVSHPCRARYPPRDNGLLWLAVRSSHPGGSPMKLLSVGRFCHLSSEVSYLCGTEPSLKPPKGVCAQACSQCWNGTHTAGAFSSFLWWACCTVSNWCCLLRSQAFFFAPFLASGWALKRRKEGRYWGRDSLLLAPSPVLSALQQSGLSALHPSLLCKSTWLCDWKVKDQNLAHFNNPRSTVMKT